ncbi:tetratricopeptide repeat protein [Streptomyces sp. DH12]|uniref:serine/threonine-protein kinase n=1 Tax=Streptomyces sp. DH12 TaxID=2857010 RepID=UPI0027D31861|nr:tetratricopeptide repeat protein [Streptomyces sp. DH12]
MSRCPRPGCGGAYEDVGGGRLYCDTCGLAPAAAPDGPVSGGPAPRDVVRRDPVPQDVVPRDLVPQDPVPQDVVPQDPVPRDLAPRDLVPPGSPAPEGPAPHEPAPGPPDPVIAPAVPAAPASGATVRSLPARGPGASPSGRSASRGRLGAGLVTVPAVPRPDPRTAVTDCPEVPERRRFCSRSDCGAPVGRARGGRAGRTEGFCTACGHPYSFVPKLRAGDVVHGQYEVAGCLAHGGLGWVYLAVDRAVSDRWVVLKGLLDTGDEDAMAAAISERRFLAEIEHANIVRIYNFVEHLDQRTGSLDGYIVMEYVGGKSLKEVADERRQASPDSAPRSGRGFPVPVGQACAYGIEALEALGHLHDRNLLYCDFKVDNAIQSEDQLKLIDMGAVRRMDDRESAVYGTVGYQAPEVAECGPSVASDLYTVARTLAVLTFDFHGYTTVFADTLPDPRHVPVFRRYESFHRLLVRATDPDPARRFGSAQEMAEQLTGVLREVVALETGTPRPALSTLFGPERRVADTVLFAEPADEVSRLGPRPTGRRRWSPARAGGPVPAGGPVRAGRAGVLRRSARTGTAGRTGGPAQGAAPAVGAGGGAAGRGGTAEVAGPPPLAPLDARAAALALPVPLLDPDDPNAALLSGLAASGPAELLAALRAAPTDSPELRLREVRALLELGDTAAAARALDAFGRARPGDWRVVWCHGVTALATGEHAAAARDFDAVYAAFPGEPAPKLALAVCAEVLGRPDDAAAHHHLVWATDPGHVGAAFGLARVRLAAGDRAAAVRTLESVPESSSHYTAARVAAVRARIRRRDPREPLRDDLYAAARQITALDALGLDPVRRERLSAEVLGLALDWWLSGRAGGLSPDHPLLGSELHERGLRFGLERSYRVLARLAQRGEERIELVERANRFRPRTWV